MAAKRKNTVPDPRTLANPPGSPSGRGAPHVAPRTPAGGLLTSPPRPPGASGPASGGSAPGPPVLPAGPTAYAVNRVHALAAEMARRRCEALALYEPLATQALFHPSKARYRLARGSNRSGKTLIAAVEVARAATGQDPFGKYPLRDGLAFLVGKDQRHLGRVMYAKLFRAGAFKMIRDEATGAWRAYRRWMDQPREAWARPAPPLIPPRFVAEIAWENKKENVPAVVRLVNGWELDFYSSLGKPPKGSPIDLFWFDEEIIDPLWYPEMAARIVDRRGRGIWSFTPEAGTEQAYELHERAEAERVRLEPEQRSIAEFEILLADNTHLDEQAKRDLAADLDEEQARVKVGGEYAITGDRVYPTFSLGLHGYDPCEVPPSWTTYAYVDPGHRVCAALFAAVPPREVGDFILLYDELYIREATADSFAQAMAKACSGRAPQAFLIDYHMAIHTEVGIGKTVLQLYSDALARHKVQSVATGSGFILASDDVAAGILAVQGMLRVRSCGTPRLRVMRERLPEFCWEIKRYHRKRVAGKVTNAPDQRKDNHLMDCLRYLALHEPRFVKARPMKAGPGGAVRHLREKLKRRREAAGAGHVHLGPGVGGGKPW
jgi:hypothetical protein